MATRIIPGVYTELTSEQFLPSVVLNGGVIGFVGDFVFGEVNKVIEIRNFNDIEAKLGGLAKDDAKALYTILMQKPRKVKVVRIVGDGAAKASVDLKDSTSNTLITLTAKYLGEYGNDITVKIDSSKLSISYADVTESYTLSDMQTLVDNINKTSKLVDASFVSDGTLETGTFPLTGGSDGTINDDAYIGSYDPNADKRTGLAVFEIDNDTEIIVFGGTASKTKNDALIEHASKFERIAVVNLTDNSNLTNAITDAANYREDYGRAITAFPAVNMNINGEKVTIDAAYVLAGILGRVDPHRTTANQAIYGAVGVARGLTTAEIEQLIVNKINPITIKGNGYAIRHGLTLTNSDNWAQIEVVRVFNLIAKNVDEMLNDFIGEPNTPALWEDVKAKLGGYLQGLKTSSWIYDYRVICDASVNPPEDRENGVLNVKLYIKPVYAAYYIEVEINKTLAFETEQE